jgi:hypothetical protein
MKHDYERGTTFELSSSAHQQLKSYVLAAAAAGVSALALAKPAEGKIIYTPAHQKIPVDQSFFLDLNHDNVKDFEFFIRNSGETCARPQTCSSWDAAIMFLYPQVKGNGAVGKPAYASALKAGVAVGPKEAFNTSRGIMGGVSFRNGELTYSGGWADSGKPVDDRYLGIRLMIKGKVHYGWARLNVKVFRDPKSQITATLTGYAYETVPNKRIIAGKTKGPDLTTVQPATLGTLALGRR